MEIQIFDNQTTEKTRTRRPPTPLTSLVEIKITAQRRETLKTMQLGLPESARESASSILVRVDVVERRGLNVLSSKFNAGLRGMMMMNE